MTVTLLLAIILLVVGLTAVFYAAKAPTGTLMLRILIAAVGFLLVVIGAYLGHVIT